MLLALLIWVGASLACALALAGAAARPLPSAAEQDSLLTEQPPMPLSPPLATDARKAMPPTGATLGAHVLAGLDS